jgi:hypothetical protein
LVNCAKMPENENILTACEVSRAPCCLSISAFQ